jgi:hypothetical protein
MQTSAPPTDDTHRLRPGQLATAWRTTFIAGWVGVVAGIGAVWQACRVGGIAPWWLGPETNRKSVFLIALPFLPPAIAIVAAVRGLRYTCQIGIICGLALAAIALGDLEYPGLALVEAILGFAGVIISVACLAGRMRPPEEPAQVVVTTPQE